MFILLLDSSGSWRFIAAVVVQKVPQISCYHVAGLDKSKRKKIIKQALEILSTECYSICVHAFIHQKIRMLSYGNRKSKKRLWRGAIKHELIKIANHLKNIKFWPIDIVYADREFELYRDMIENVFGIDNVSIEKSDKLCLADVVAYLNLSNPRSLRTIKNFKEIR